jgi:ArsR family transcriptional regulator
MYPPVASVRKVFYINRKFTIYDYMALTKAHKFNKTQVRTAELAKALGHPARIAILEILAHRNTCICGDITDELPLAQSTVSQHLKALKKVGIIKGEIDGVRTCYCINEKAAVELKELLGLFVENIQTQNCC